MDDSPKWKPQTESQFYVDGRSMRQPVEGTVPYGRADFDIDDTKESWAAPFKVERDDLIKEDDGFYRGLAGTRSDGKPEYLRTIPIPVTTTRRIFFPLPARGGTVGGTRAGVGKFGGGKLSYAFR